MAGTVFFDVDTQIDFVFPAGSLYVPGAERLIPTVARLNQLAAAHGVLVLSTVDAHPEYDSEFTEYSAHCVSGAVGQRKPEATLLDGRAVLAEDSRAETVSLAGARQILVEKSTVDCFRNRNLGPYLAALGVTRFVLYGVATEVAVRHAALGLLRLGHDVQLVSDAIQGINQPMARRTMDEFMRGGGRVVESTALVPSAWSR